MSDYVNKSFHMNNTQRPKMSSNSKYSHGKKSEELKGQYRERSKTGRKPSKQLQFL